MHSPLADITRYHDQIVRGPETHREIAKMALPSSRESIQALCRTINSFDRSLNAAFFYKGLLERINAVFLDIHEIQRKWELIENFSWVQVKIPRRIKREMTPILERGKLTFQSFLTNKARSFKDEIQREFDRRTIKQLERDMEYIHSMNISTRKIRDLMKSCLRDASEKRRLLTFVEGSDRDFNQSVRRQSRRRIYPILSIDGGGIRGIIPARMLAEIERVTGRATSSLFRLIGGTSTGGILALGLTKPDRRGRAAYSAEDLLEMYTTEHGSIFRPNPNYLSDPDTSELSLTERVRFALRNHKYQSPVFFEEKFGQARASDALTNVLITTNTTDSVIEKTASVLVSISSVVINLLTRAGIYSDEGHRTIHYFTKEGRSRVSYTSRPRGDRYLLDPCRNILEIYNFHPGIPDETNPLMSTLAKVTSAAPTYFPVQQLGDDVLLDGGILQNNPTMPCIFEGLYQGVRRKDIFVVSLGTGSECFSIADTLSSSMISLWFETTQPDPDIQLRVESMLNPGAYHRYQYKFEGSAPALDDSSPESIKLLEEAGDALVEANADSIRDVCRVLYPECI